ncbi:hypothetical protein ANTPLA_LOCUS6402 [Anthophora plagiata]
MISNPRGTSGAIDGTRFLPADEETKNKTVGGESRILKECTFRDILVEDGMHKNEEEKREKRKYIGSKRRK